jgi:hypothetical protein
MSQRQQPAVGRSGSALPADCPVKPLGYHDDARGRRFFYLDSAGRVVGLRASEHTKENLLALFGGNEAYLKSKWPSYDKPPGRDR